jgi:hypothetical protein
MQNILGKREWLRKFQFSMQNILGKREWPHKFWVYVSKVFNILYPIFLSKKYGKNILVEN